MRNYFKMVKLFLPQVFILLQMVLLWKKVVLLLI